mgnify:CR=1 FL=1
MSSLAVYIPVLNKLVPMVLRIAFFYPGYFLDQRFQAGHRRDFALQPDSSGSRLMRMSLHDSYVVDGLSFAYLSGFTLTVLVLGGFLERYVRSRRKDQ